MTLETCDESDEQTRPDQQNDNVKDKDNDKNVLRTPLKSNPRVLLPLRHLIRMMRRHDLTNKKTITITKAKTKTKTMTKTFGEHP